MRLISDIIDNRQLLDFSQNFGVQRTYMGSALFPDRKTEYIEQEYTRLCENGNLPLIAKVHALDTEAHIGNRIPFEKVTVEELLIKEKINLTERMRRITRGLSMDMDAARRYIFDDVARMAETVVTRAELAKMDALSKGKYVISENGLNIEIDYKVPESNFVKSDWSDQDADILGDVRKWRMAAMEKGVAPTLAVTTENVLFNIMRNNHVQRAIFGNAGVGTLPTVDQINALFASQFGGLRIATNEDKYATLAEGGAKLVQNRFFPENKFVMFAAVNGAIGTGLWGVTPEEDAQGGAFDSKRQVQYVTCTTWDDKDPVATWTKASGLFVPVMPNVYGHMIADVAGGTGVSEG